MQKGHNAILQKSKTDTLPLAIRVAGSVQHVCTKPIVWACVGLTS